MNERGSKGDMFSSKVRLQTLCYVSFSWRVQCISSLVPEKSERGWIT